MSGWWLDEQVDWTGADPVCLVQLLTYAYPTRPDVQRALLGVGTEADGLPADAVGEALWRAALTAVAADGNTLDLASLVLGDSNASQFHAPLRELLGPQLSRLVHRLGLPTEGRAATLEALSSSPAVATDQPIEGFEAITSPPAGFQDLNSWIATLFAVRGRTAMIERGGHALGTGVLVGDDLLLTAGHVVGLAPWPPASVEGLVARFDYYDQGQLPAETGVRVRITALEAESPPTTLESEQAAANRWNAAAAELDYALLRLERGISRELTTGSFPAPRGFFPTFADDYDFARAPLLIVIQHPLGDFQKVSYSNGLTEVNGNRTRIRYGANTLRGSSGSPVIDPLGQLVALHHYSTLTKNQGVTMSSIRTAISARLGEKALSQPAAIAAPPASAVGPDAFGVKVLGRAPFANRMTLRSEVSAMSGPAGARILVIDGQIDSGVSTSYDYLAHVAAASQAQPGLIPGAPGGLRVIPIDLRRHRNRAVAVQQEKILELLSMYVPTPSGEAIAEPARDVDTLRHSWLTGLPSGTQHWVFVDSVDSVTEVVQSGLNELIRALGDLARDPQVHVRMVLAGREASGVADLCGLDFPGEDRATGLSRLDIDEWVRDRAAEDGREVVEDLLVRQLDSLFTAAAANPTLRWLALRLPALYLEVTK